jgi:hypothetical protein
MDKRLLKALLHDVFGVFPVASDTQRHEENSLLVTFDQLCKRRSFPYLGVSNQHFVFVRVRFRYFYLVCEFNWQRFAPSSISEKTACRDFLPLID